MASFGWAFLLCLALAQLHTVVLSSTHHAPAGGNLTDHLPVPFLCHPDQAKALLQLKKSFSFRYSTTTLSSWRDGTDCCLWEGVGCDASSGNVTILDLSNRLLFSYGLDPAVFNLTSLRRLDLSRNDFSGDSVEDDRTLADNIPATGFERLTLLTHLNLSCLGLRGPIDGVGQLVNLVSLDLSTPDDLYGSLREPDFDALLPDLYISLREAHFDALVANLSNLRELYLDSVNLASSGEGWCISLATYVPHLEILSMADCRLTGPICKSLSKLSSLVVLNLQENDGITAAPFPEFLMDLPNLTKLQFSNVNLEGSFPSRPFQSKNIRVLDLSSNQNLSGHVPNFSNASSVESLMLDGTNFLPANATPSSNMKSLKELVLDGNLVSVDFLSSFGALESLRQLDLTVKSSSELGSIFSWIGQHKNLVSLALSGCDFSNITPTLLNNFKTLRRLTMVDCLLPKKVFHAIGNLVSLRTLEMNNCKSYGSIPASVGNLTNLRNMILFNCGFSGAMPAAIGKLTNLRNMYMSGCQFSGPMPAAIGKLTNLRTMGINFCGFSGPVPDAIGNLTNLRYMYIYGNSFLSGPLPAAIGNLTNLKEMDFQGQIFGLSIPYAIGQLSELAWLSLRDCNFSGSIPSSIANLTHLTMLDLASNSLSGKNTVSGIIFLPYP